MGRETHCGSPEHALAHDIGDARTGLASSIPARREAKLGRMRLPSAAAASRRDPVNALYDSASELLQAARELNVAAARPGSAPALAATIGCLEASLDALAQSIDSARSRLHEQLQHDRLQRSPGRRSAVANLEVLRQELDQASRAARVARRTVGPLVADSGPA
jgi:hypothetical protein